MFRLAALAAALLTTVLLSQPTSAQQKKLTEEEKQLLFERASKKLLDPTADSKEFSQAIGDLAGRGKELKAKDKDKADKAQPVFLKAADLYAEELEKAEKAKEEAAAATAFSRFKAIVRHLPPDKIEAKHAKTLALRFAADEKPATDQMLVQEIDFLGTLGPKAKAAIPALKAIRDDEKAKKSVVVAASRAIKLIGDNGEAAALPKKSPADEEKQFLLDRAVKTLLDPKADGDDFGAAFVEVVVSKEKGQPHMLKALDVYAEELAKAMKAKKQEDIDRNLRRFNRIVAELPVSKIEARHAKVIAERFSSESSSSTPIELMKQIEFLGKLGAKAKDALPALKKIRDDPKEERDVVAAAFRAIKQIEADK